MHSFSSQVVVNAPRLLAAGVLTLSIASLASAAHPLSLPQWYATPSNAAQQQWSLAHASSMAVPSSTKFTGLAATLVKGPSYLGPSPDYFAFRRPPAEWSGSPFAGDDTEIEPPVIVGASMGGGSGNSVLVDLVGEPDTSPFSISDALEEWYIQDGSTKDPPVVVPIPAPALLTGLGLLGAVIVRRRFMRS